MLPTRFHMLDFIWYNEHMVYHGKVQNGMIVLEGN